MKLLFERSRELLIAKTSRLSLDKLGIARRISPGGFTLIELLVVIVVLASIGSIVAGVVTFSLRGSNKANNIQNIRQNGNYVLSQMSKTIEYAKAFEGISDNGTDFEIFCDPTAPNPTPTPSSDDFKYIKIKPFVGTDITYRCEGNTITQNGTSLIDTSTIEVSNCTFTCTYSRTSDVPIIGIKFDLQSSGSNVFVEKSNPPITFETSVTIRNYTR